MKWLICCILLGVSSLVGTVYGLDNLNRLRETQREIERMSSEQAELLKEIEELGSQAGPLRQTYVTRHEVFNSYVEDRRSYTRGVTIAIALLVILIPGTLITGLKFRKTRVVQALPG
jgi:hypothetical protein